ncbi:MAG: plastocyanin/azurin family copper-binding protein [Armatimonadota bacterium]|nr:plastocyanin/azurin family copper-binding protein [Armatimonadota bacterium]
MSGVISRSKTRGMLVAAGIIALVSMSQTSFADASERTEKAVAFRSDMRKLWEDHVFYTRMVIISVAGGLQDLKPTTTRLLQNQVDIGNAIKPYYGDNAGSKLTSLLQDHINTAAELLVAAKAGDTAKMNDAKSRWYDNGDEIAAFLSSANPQNWPLDTVKSLMKTHLDTTIDEAVARLHGDWKGDIDAFDKANKHILVMADALSLGVIRQFPEKFADSAVNAPARVQVSMEDNTFVPREIAAPAGCLIEWTNKGGNPHTVTSDGKNAVPGGPDSGAQYKNGIQPGESYTWTVPANAKSGTKWYYHCAFHGSEGDGASLGSGMSGVIMVR